jgi:AcrR family transcriptional regulator
MHNPYAYILDLKTPAETPSQAALKGALISLEEERPFRSIEVKKLCARAFVSRSTFYAYYDNIDQLLAQIEDTHVIAITQLNACIPDRGISNIDDTRFYADTMEYVREHEDVFRALLLADPDARFVAKWKDAIKLHFWERMAHEHMSGNPPFVLEIIASSVVAAFTYMLEHPGTVRPEDMYPLVMKAFAAIDD